MPPLVTSNARVICAHGGQVQLIPKQPVTKAQGGFVLCEGDLIGSPIVGCAQPPSPSTKPCTLVVSTLPGGSNPRVLVSGRPAHHAGLTGMTDGVPPGVITVVYPGQVVVQG